jgi:hypothetical protein
MGTRPSAAINAQTCVIEALRVACVEGDLGAAERLAATSGLTAADARANGNFVLRAACANGRLDIVQWLVATFGLTVADAYGVNGDAFLLVCGNGHLTVAKWLAARFGIFGLVATAAPPRAHHISRGNSTTSTKRC